MSALQPWEGASLAGALGGLVVNRLFDLPGAPLPANFLTFTLGAAPAALATFVMLDEDGANMVLFQGSYDFMTQAPFSFMAIVFGMTTVLSVTFELTVMPEVDAFATFIPFFNFRGIDVAILGLGTVGAFVWGGILGWPLEIIEWLALGADTSKIPAKPGNRSDWGITKLPKDVMVLLLASPITMYYAFSDLITHGQILPVMMIPLQTAATAWHRIGDVMLDVILTVKKFTRVIGKSFNVFNFLVSGIPGSGAVNILAGASTSLAATGSQPDTYVIGGPAPDVAYQTLYTQAYDGTQITLFPRWTIAGLDE